MPLRSTLNRAERGLREALHDIDGAIRELRQQAEQREKDLLAERKVVERALSDLQRADGRKRKNQRGYEDFVKLAGRRNVERVREYLEQHGRAFQSDITSGLGLSSGNVSHALRALAAHPDGPLIRVTGQVRRASKEYEYLGAKRAEEAAPEEAEEAEEAQPDAVASTA